MNTIKRYDIAKCSLGIISLITSKTPTPITYSDGTSGNAVGVGIRYSGF